jgi:hypothetical protein
LDFEVVIDGVGFKSGGGMMVLPTGKQNRCYLFVRIKIEKINIKKSTRLENDM